MKAVLWLLIVLLAAGVVVQSLRVARLRVETDALRQQIAATQKHAEALAENAKSASATAPDSETERTELLRLRNQAAQLRTVTNELQQLRARVEQLQAAQANVAHSTPAAPTYPAPAGSAPVPRESWAFAGYATPDATLQSAVFAMSQGDLQAFLAAMTPEEAQRMQKSMEGKTPEQVAEEGRREMARVKSFQVLSREELAPDRVVLHLYAAGTDDRVQRVIMQKAGEEWKWAGNAGKTRQLPAQPPLQP